MKKEKFEELVSRTKVLYNEKENNYLSRQTIFLALIDVSIRIKKIENDMAELKPKMLIEDFGDPWIAPQKHDVPLNEAIKELEKDIRRIKAKPNIEVKNLQFYIDTFIKLCNVLKQELKINIDEWDYETPAIKLVKKDKETKNV